VSTTSRQHAAGASPQPNIPEPSYAERARTLAYVGRLGTLSSLSAKHPGWPFGSVMPYALDDRGSPLFLISSMAMHTQNVVKDPRAALMVAQHAGLEDALGSARVTLMGNAGKVPPEELAAVRARYLASYENAKYWVDFEDFAFYRLEIIDVYYVGGFGVMGWLSAEDYYAAEADPLADAAAGILAHMNADHVEAMILLARAHAGLEATEAQMTAVDRLGFHLRLKTAEGMKGTRIAFTSEARTPQRTREVLVEMVKAARGGSQA
jgi:heme oxygenase (biliverdin-IX-beta and delta-forming)